MNYTGYVRSQQLAGNPAARLIAAYIKHRSDRARDLRDRIKRDLHTGLIGASRYARLIAAVDSLSSSELRYDTTETPASDWSSMGRGAHVRAVHIAPVDTMERGEVGYVRA